LGAATQAGQNATATLPTAWSGRLGLSIFRPPSTSRESVEEARRTEVPERVALAAWAIAGCLRHPAVSRLVAGSKSVPRVVDHALMTGAKLDRSPGRPLRTAAIAGLTFTVLYLVHRILQSTGPDSSAPAAVAAYNLAHRSILLASEVAVGLALLAFIPFLAALVPIIWRAGQETLAVAVAISGGVFVAMGFVSNAAETALIGVADSNQPAAVLALDQLQGRTPVVWTITALVAVLSLAIQRTGLVGRWLGVVGLVAAAIFLLGSIFSVLGRSPEGNSSLLGVGLFIGWMLLLSAGLWRTAANSTSSPS
jgi:hypothetical protein